MISKDELFKIADELAQEKGLFVTEILISGGGDIEVVVDSMERVALNDCAKLSKQIEGVLDEKGLDFSLMLASAGIGSPLSDHRQFAKLTGRMVEVVKKDGLKLSGELKQAQVNESLEGVITVSYMAKEAVEGKKRKVEVQKEEVLDMSSVKSVCELLEIK